METYKYDAVILGAGAAGLAAAAAIGRYSSKKFRTALIEKESKPGKKLLATGNGRCNLTNMNMSSSYYNIGSGKIVEELLEKMPPDKLINEFKSMGMLCRTDSEGRVYPYSNRALTVLDTFMRFIDAGGVDVYCDTEIIEITPIGGGYRIKCNDKLFFSKKLILSTGGAVQKNLGSDGSSYKFAKQLGLKCEMIYPSLAPIKVNDKYLRSIKGVRAKAKVKLTADGELIGCEHGEVQFNEKNISGICVFQLSQYVNEWFVKKTVNGKKYNDLNIEIDLLPEYSYEDVLDIIEAFAKQFPNIPSSEITSGIVHEKLGVYITKKLGIKPGASAGEMTVKEKRLTAAMLKSLKFKPSAPSDYEAAQVTAGGISTDEIDETFESKKLPGLFIIGEALNADGKCGGYNLHFAFASGMLAGQACAFR